MKTNENRTFRDIKSSHTHTFHLVKAGRSQSSADNAHRWWRQDEKWVFSSSKDISLSWPMTWIQYRMRSTLPIIRRNQLMNAANAERQKASLIFFVFAWHLGIEFHKNFGHIEFRTSRLVYETTGTLNNPPQRRDESTDLINKVNEFNWNWPLIE